MDNACTGKIAIPRSSEYFNEVQAVRRGRWAKPFPASRQQLKSRSGFLLSEIDIGQILDKDLDCIGHLDPIVCERFGSHGRSPFRTIFSSRPVLLLFPITILVVPHTRYRCNTSSLGSTHGDLRTCDAPCIVPWRQQQPHWHWDLRYVKLCAFQHTRIILECPRTRYDPYGGYEV